MMPTRQKLTVEQCIEIAVEFVSGNVSVLDLAHRYGVARATIDSVLRGRGAYARYRELLPMHRIIPVLAYRTTARANKLTPDETVRLRHRFIAGETLGELATAYEISRTQVSRIVRGVSYRGAGGPVYNPKRRE